MNLIMQLHEFHAQLVLVEDISGQQYFKVGVHPVSQAVYRCRKPAKQRQVYPTLKTSHKVIRTQIKHNLMEDDGKKPLHIKPLPLIYAIFVNVIISQLLTRSLNLLIQQVIF